MIMREKIAAKYAARCNSMDMLPAYAFEIRLLIDCALDALMEPTEGMEAASIQTDEADSMDWVEALRGTGITSAQDVMVASYKSMVRAAKDGK